MNKRQKQLLTILIIAAVVFTIFALLIPFPKGGIFWIAFVAEIIALALQIPFFKAAFDNANELKSKVLGFPIFRVGYIYLGIQTAVSLALFSLGFLPGFPIWLAAVICILLLGGSIICGISVDIAHEEIEQIEKIEKKDTHLMQTLRVKAKQLVNYTEDAVLQKELEKIAENLQFSDPISSPEIADYETELEKSFKALKESVESNPEQALEKCRKFSVVLYERNEACRNNKH